MNVQAFDLKDIKIVPEYRTRKGEPDPKKVKQFLHIMVSRHDNNQSPQIENGVVRKVGDQVVLVDGEHRLLALKEFAKGLDGEDKAKIKFYATVEHTPTDLEATVTGIQSNLRAELDLLDRAAAMSKLRDGGKTVEEIKELFACSAGEVSETIAVSKLPKKIQAKIQSGTIQEKAARILASYNNDPQLQEDLLTLSEADRNAMDAIAERAEARSKAAAAASEEGGEGKGGKKSTPAKKTAAKGRKAAKGKITQENVEAAIAAKGAKKRKSASAPETTHNRTYKQFVAQVEDKEWKKDLPQPAIDLIGRIEEWFENGCGEQGLKNAFQKYCKASIQQKAAA